MVPSITILTERTVLPSATVGVALGAGQGGVGLDVAGKAEPTEGVVDGERHRQRHPWREERGRARRRP